MDSLVGYLSVGCRNRQHEEEESNEGEEISVYKSSSSTAVPVESSGHVTADSMR